MLYHFSLKSWNGAASVEALVEAIWPNRVFSHPVSPNILEIFLSLNWNVFFLSNLAKMVQFFNFNAHFVLFIHTTLNAITRYLLNKEPNKFTQLPWTMYWVFSSKEAAMKKIVPGKKSRWSGKSSNIFLLENLCPHYISREWKAWCESSVMLDTTTTESIQILSERTTRKAALFSIWKRDKGDFNM